MLPIDTPTNIASGKRREQSEFRAALKVSAATMPGIFAWGLVSGMAMVKSGLTLWQALGMSFFVFAGSAQLAALPLIAAGAPVWVVFVTALMVNLRFVIFAAVVGPHFAHLKWYQRLWYGYFNADIAMGFFPRRFPNNTVHQPVGKVGYYTGICYSNWVVWQTSAVIGILLASQIPESWGVGFAGTLALLAVLIPMTINRAALGGVIVSGVIAVAAAGLPYRLGLLIGVIAGMIVAMLIDSLMEKASEKKRSTDASNNVTEGTP
jgi:predicted branched-subunit amino acid permease